MPAKTNFDTIREGTIERVNKYEDGFEIVFGGGIGCMLSKERLGDAEPKVGDFFRVHCVRLSRIRGASLNRQELFYLSDEEIEEEDRKMREEHEAKQKARFEEVREELDDKYARDEENHGHDERDP